MPIQNLNKLFNSPFYIDGKYAESFIPLFAGALMGKVDLSQAEKPVVSVSTQKLEFGATAEADTRSVAIISIKSPIIKFSTYTAPGTRDIWAQISSLDRDPNIAGIVLDIDSGGGQVYGTPEFFDNLRNLQTPLVAYTDGLMCSAAYYIAAACDYIIANKRADAIGSIGAYAQFFDFTGFWEKHGAKMHTLYADQSTEKNKDYREVMEGKYESYIKKSLNPTVDTFIADMKSARPQLSEEVFKGATWGGPEALERNLVDALGTLQDAVTKVFELAGKEKLSTNTNNMSKPQSFPNLETVLGLSEPLAITENGSYLNEEQKQTLEDQLAGSAADLQAAKDAQAKAEADLQAEKDAHQASVEASTETVTGTVAQLRAVADLAGVEGLADDASAEDINAALTARINEMNAAPGATHTSTASDDEVAGAHEYIDFKNSSIYQNN